MSLADAKAHLSEVVNQVRTEHARVVVTVYGQAAAVMVSPDDLEAMEETIAILGDPVTMAHLQESEAELVRGEVCSLEDVAEQMRATGRLP